MATSFLKLRPGAPRRNDLRVGTPDPTKYHDPSTVKLEGRQGTLSTFLPGDHGYSGLRGTIIPRATQLGGSLGHNPHKPMVIHIDPELLGGEGIVVDLAKVNQSNMAEAVIQEQRAGYADPAEAMIAAYSHFAPTESQVVKVPAAPQEEIREAPIHMPGAYVVPKATKGGGQVKAASFQAPQAQVPVVQAPQFSEEPTPVPLPPEKPKQRPQPQQPQQVAEQYNAPPPPSLMASLNERPSQAPVMAKQAQRQARQVIFELPGPVGQFQTYYHDVIRNEAGDALILVYDHSQPLQMVWFPQYIYNEQGEPQPLSFAALVQGGNGEPAKIYRLQSTPFRYTYRNEEFCVLLIEQEAEYKPGA